MKLLILIVVFSCLCSTVPAESYRGPPPAEQKEAIHTLARNHSELVRVVTLTETGYEALTTSENSELVKQLKSHVAYMKKRLDSGAMVRRWDPAFVELVEHHDDINVTVEERENGIAVVVTGENADAVKVAQNHAKIVSGFVSEGKTAVQREHEAVLAEE